MMRKRITLKLTNVFTKLRTENANAKKKNSLFQMMQRNILQGISNNNNSSNTYQQNEYWRINRYCR